MADGDKQRAARARVTRAETIGLAIVVLIILLVVILRWGAHIDWRAR